MERLKVTKAELDALSQIMVGIELENLKRKDTNMKTQKHSNLDSKQKDFKTIESEERGRGLGEYGRAILRENLDEIARILQEMDDETEERKTDKPLFLF